MSRTFKTARAGHHATGPFLNEDHFAETFSFHPVTGGVARSVIGHFHYEREIAQGEYIETDQERVWVKVMRDEGAGKGGIGAPRVGDRLFRDNDPVNTPFVYQGEIRSATPHAWQLLFSRPRPRRAGPSR